MSLIRIVLKNLAQRKLSSALTGASIALGVAVVVAILTLQSQSRAAFGQSAVGYDLIVGPRGSPLQLVLVTVFHLDQLQGTIPYAVYKELAGDRRVRAAVPLAVGDSYQGFRIVATSDRFLTTFEVQPGRRFELAEGRVFEFSEPMLDHLMAAGSHHAHEHEGMKFEAVLGHLAAQRTGLRAGSTFEAAHGLEAGPGTKTHTERWTVTGVLKPTGTPIDKAIFINLDSFFAVGDHAKAAEQGRGGHISAVVVLAKGGHASRDLRYDFQRRTDAMAVAPVEVIQNLFDLLGNVDTLLLAVSILVILVAGVSILVSIYNSMSERKRPIAIMRALGARRATILSIILLEATALCFIGGVAGVASGHVLAESAGRILRNQAGISISGWAVHPMEGAVIGGLLVLGVLVGLLPALKAYRTDISDGLNPTS